MSILLSFNRSICTAVLCLGLGALGSGCGDEKKDAPAPAAPAASTPKPAPATQPLVAVPQMIDWCREHGMPESICVQCNASLAASYKEKGDWDEQHKLPKSQCFKCDPKLKDQFAAAYKAKYGKDAPAIAEGEGH